MRVFMIGATGLLGAKAAEIFLERGHSVTGVALPPLPQGANLPEGMKLELCNIYEKTDAQIRELLRGGHWCPQELPWPWNYDEEAKINPFFAQVWYAAQDPGEHNVYGPEIFDDFREKVTQ